MALDPVPFVIGGDAEHGPDVFRQALYVATGGKQGVGSPSDLKVTPLDVPGAGVKIAAGGGTILNRTATQESYGVRNPTADTGSIQVPASGSSSKRTHLIVCRVDNPYVDGNAQAPVDPVHGPYNSFALIPDVPAGTRLLQEVPQYKGLSAIELCRLDVPAATQTITAAMITDLRQLTRANSDMISFSDLGVSTATLSATSGTIFPPFRPSVVVPDWANYVRVELIITSLSALGNSTGKYNVQLQDSAGNNVIEGNSVSFNADAVVTSTRVNLLAMAEGDITAARGKTLRPTTLMRKTDTKQANLKYDDASQMLYRVTFYERLA
jgi:hypothetical protein